MRLDHSYNEGNVTSRSCSCAQEFDSRVFVGIAREFKCEPTIIILTLVCKIAAQWRKSIKDTDVRLAFVKYA